MSEKPYRQYQEMYEALVSDHEDDFSNMPIVHHPELVNNALHYFREATFPLIYPAKAYAVAIIYATLMEKEYGILARETLNDPELFMGHDEYFVTYGEDPETYDAILKGLEELPDWISSGWAPKTARYWYLECTAAGNEEVIRKMEEQD